MKANPSLQTILEEIAEEVRPYSGRGKVADYIPVLRSINPDQFGMVVCSASGEEFKVGAAETPFSTQSISKLFTLAMLMKALGDESGVIWERVRTRPSNNPFNSLIQLEAEHGIPRNPFVNAGALVVTDYLISLVPETLQALLEKVRSLSRNPAIAYDALVARSEKEVGHRNYALLHFLKSLNNIHNPIEQVMDVYVHQCSLAMSCLDLARSFLFLVQDGTCPVTGTHAVSPVQAKRLNALMLTCGLYDAVGEFAFRVGLPGKSGVGGGIVAVLPRKWSVAVWCPELNETGNSVVGIKALELLTSKTGESIF